MQTYGTFFPVQALIARLQRTLARQRIALAETEAQLEAAREMRSSEEAAAALRPKT